VDSRSCGSIGGCCDSRRGLCCRHFPCLEPKLWPVVRRQASSAGQSQSQEVPQAVARARNHTWVELLSVLSAGTRLEPLSAVISTSFSSSRSCRGAIVALRALAEFCFHEKEALSVVGGLLKNIMSGKISALSPSGPGLLPLAMLSIAIAF